MNKGDFLRYIILQCSKCVLTTADIILAYMRVHKTCRVCRNFFTWDTHHFKEFYPRGVLSYIAARGDAYLLLIIRMPPLLNDCGWSENTFDNTYHKWLYKNITMSVHPNGKIETSDAKGELIMQITPERVKKRIKL